MTCIIIDDEKNAREGLQLLIKNFVPDLEVLRLCKSGAEGIAAIEELNPKLIFLDVEMPHMTGFEMLEKIPNKNFDVIFSTAYDHYALKAIKFSALDYLLKPVSPDELIAAIQKHKEKKQPETNLALEHLLKSIKNPHQQLSKIALPSTNGLAFVPVENIIRFESDSNYTDAFLVNGEKVCITKTLKQIEESLEGHPFYRVHQSHFVNLNHIKEFVRDGGGYLVMSDKTTITVARQRKDGFMEMFSKI